MWRCSVLLLGFTVFICSCKRTEPSNKPKPLAIDSITYTFRSDYDCSMRLRDEGIKFYITFKKKLSNTLYVGKDGFVVKFEVDENAAKEKKDAYCLKISEPLPLLSLKEMQEVGELYLPTKKASRGYLKDLDEVIIDSVIVTAATQISYYLDDKTVSPADSVSMNKRKPFTPLEIPNN